MNTIAIKTRPDYRALAVGLGFLLFLLSCELGAILFLNHGHMVYTLDDPYIHLALAENIRQGHFGVNLGEYSAPSSSIVWPFILAIAPSLEIFPLLLNIAFAVLTLVVFNRILIASLPLHCRWASFHALILILAVIITNTVGLVFTGMEHSLQLLSVILIAHGLITEAEKGKISWALILAIVAAPLIRYENLAVSFAAIAYLWMRNHYKHSVLLLLPIALLMGGYSLFLTQLGLEPFPTSILEKSAVINKGGQFLSVWGNFKANIAQGRGQILICMALGFAGYLFSNHHPGKRPLAFAALLAITLHMGAGKFGWYNRYEIYIWGFSLSICLYLWGHLIEYLFIRAKGHLAFRPMVFYVLIIAISYPYVLNIFTLPLASNNIYEQQYQMRRFAVDYFGKPVAVNDLGYVAYKNDNYVLDLWGLASLESLRYRQNATDGEWMNTLCKQKNVELAMIYDWWFPSRPKSWHKVGTLRLGKRKIAPYWHEVSFYAINKNSFVDIKRKLDDFQKKLPHGVVFRFENTETP